MLKGNKLQQIVYRFKDSDTIPALLISIVFSILPTARARNIGYVDPNLYIGYATNMNWLVQSGGFEYHATRLPFIYLIKTLLAVSVEYFGILYKFTLLVAISLTILKIAKRFNLHRILAISLTIVLLFTPLVISAVSWTMPNAFAAIFSCGVVLFGLKADNKKFHYFLMGSLFSISFLLNAFGSSLVILFVLYLYWLNSQSLLTYLNRILLIFLGIFSTAFLFQIIWSYLLHFSGSFWKPHFDVIFNRKQLILNWEPISNLSQQGVAPFIALGFLLVIMLSIEISTKSMKYVMILKSLLLVYSYCWLTYLLKINFSFTSFWYYYIYLPIFILTSVLVVAMAQSSFRNRKLNQINISKHRAIVFLPSILLINILLLQFNNISLISAYSSNSHTVSNDLLKDEIKLNKILSKLPPGEKEVTTWYEPDAEGYRGSLISSTSFHLIRFEAAGNNMSKLNFEDYYKRNGTLPSCVVMITSKLWTLKNEIAPEERYVLTEKVVLPSNRTLVSTYCKERA